MTGSKCFLVFMKLCHVIIIVIIINVCILYGGSSRHTVWVIIIVYNIKKEQITINALVTKSRSFF